MRTLMKLALLAALIVATSSIHATLGAMAPVRVGPALHVDRSARVRS